MEPIRVILLPGSVLPAGPAYGGLLEELGPGVDGVAKDLELYGGDAPPPDWSLDTEADGVLRAAGRRGWDTFHLVGYSGGGSAALALISAFIRTFKSYRLDRDRLAAFIRPVLFILGGKSNPDDYADNAGRLGRVFSDFRLEVLPDRHHFDPPHRIEPQRVAALLREHWARAESRAGEQ